MALSEEIEKGRKDIISDGYDMSVGELMNLYRDKEIQISPEFQRLFRWESTRKTRFLESILLGLPLPPIFVYQTTEGIWELIDGLQRLSTIFEFTGVLRDADAKLVPSSILEGTRILPSLSGKRWENIEGVDDGIGGALQLQIKRARMRVEILKSQSDPQVKFELFQRLNTGGANLSEQEVRNCVAIMIDRTFHMWLLECANNSNFRNTISQTENAIERQIHVELALRFFVFRAVPYQPSLDVHEFLDSALVMIASTSTNFDREAQRQIFTRTFSLLNVAMSEDVFKRWNGNTFAGKFLMSVFEVVALGVAANLDAIAALPNPNDFIRTKCQQLGQNQTFTNYSGAGVRGTTRLANLLQLGPEYFRP